MKSLKQVMYILAAMAKAKSLAMKNKTNAIKTQLMLYKLLHDKKVMMSVLLQENHAVKADDKVKDDYNKSVVSHREEKEKEEEVDEEYPYIITNPFCELELEDRNGDDFDNEIDEAADAFIRRFHMQIKIQKQESFNKYQEMLERGL